MQCPGTTTTLKVGAASLQQCGSEQSTIYRNNILCNLITGMLYFSNQDLSSFKVQYDFSICKSCISITKFQSYSLATADFLLARELTCFALGPRFHFWIIHIDVYSNSSS